MRKSACVALGLGGAVIAALAAGSAMAGQELGQPLPQRAPEKVYASVCGYCHGTNVGPIILGRKLAPALIKTMVRSGMNGMPSFRPSEISDAELNDLAVWIEKSKANPKEKGK
ncbi:cytochrome c [Novosphingobium sp. FSY-8]|uniref:Cytochrome c n=1 Tax=Novosphingobium ovatum TaxID=1908523 RepID=A0ABW9XDV5_9SPHN|nr:cytochrome c [Novosphingobium ovatum]NBC36710.1 cytochrome c [Novosphingobium ovatum]